MRIIRNPDLSEFSRIGIGPIADALIDMDDLDDLHKARDVFKNGHILIGECTNILFCRKRVGNVIRININNVEIKDRGVLYSGAGTNLSWLSELSVENNLAGLEWAYGLPGTVGGAVFGNAGAFGGEIKDTIKYVGVLDVRSGEVVVLNNDECRFGYRESIFKQNSNLVILGAEFKLDLVDNKTKIELIKRQNEILKYRHTKHPTKCKTLGSTFKNVDVKNIPEDVKNEFGHFIKNDPKPILPVAVLLDYAGMKGYRIGGVGFSFQHPNFLINYSSEKTTFSDAVNLIELAKYRIYDIFNIKVEEEIRIIK